MYVSVCEMDVRVWKCMEVHEKCMEVYLAILTKGYT